MIRSTPPCFLKTQRKVGGQSVQQAASALRRKRQHVKGKKPKLNQMLDFQ